MSLDDAVRLVESRRFLCIAADERLLRSLPAGNWIGGTIPYFMGQDGGTSTQDALFVTAFPVLAGPPTIRFYDATQLPQVCADAPENGFSLVIIPAFSDLHSRFAYDAPSYADMYLKPLVGWIAGIHLDDLATARPAVVNGMTGEIDCERAIVMHVELPSELSAQIDIINLFRQGDGDRIIFPETGFAADRCLINGEPGNLADYLTGHTIDTRLPLVANYCGALVNVSFKGVDADRRRVEFYAPVFPDIEYRLAAEVPNYVTAFQAAVPNAERTLAFSCNCILNYLYSELEGKRTGHLRGPMTFGEIAYQLVNQTLVYLSIDGD
ncbi:MAG: hypothetical protein HZB40_07500 [Rhodocyclales bacterium]|nr:hypothetical protein [Rhodocyclales bacterium]